MPERELGSHMSTLAHFTRMLWTEGSGKVCPWNLKKQGDRFSDQTTLEYAGKVHKKIREPPLQPKLILVTTKILYSQHWYGQNVLLTKK